MSFKKKTTRKRNKEVEKVIQNAKIVATKCFHIEHFDNCSEYDFIGFACFDASLRPSTGRVIQEIRKSGTEVIMLTGDGPAAALAIAKKSDFFDRPKRVAYLSVDDTSNLIWHIASFKNGQGSNFKDFNEENTKEILSKVDSGKYVIVAIGRAIEIMNDDNDESSLLMLQNIDKISVIARSSPQTKQYVVSTLRNHCEKKVMFVGDGVNDISAMKAADVSGAILNGYGSEDTNSIEGDIENERRMEKLKDRKVGKDKSNQKIGKDRVKLKIEEALKSSDDPGHSMNALVKVLKEEYQRHKNLQRGGAKAARILQKEERLRQALIQKVNATSDEEEGIESIAPGEASLAAAFTFLRPAIDGVDFVIRNGISSAASSLSSRRSIALNCLMSCCNLASLYRDGFRYGKYMWNVELALMMALDQGQDDVSSIPRPRISAIRPKESLFHPSVALSVFLQALVHLFVLNLGVFGAGKLQSQYSSQSRGLSVRLAKSRLEGNIPVVTSGEMDVGDGNLLGRAPFKPNHVTNAVFLISLFQNMMVSIMNHLGTPFQGSLLESKSFCLSSSCTAMLTIVLILELSPFLNKILQLAPMNSPHFKRLMMVLLFVDGVGSLVADSLSTYFLDYELFQMRRGSKVLVDETDVDSELSADLEESLLLEERVGNTKMLTGVCVAVFLYLVSGRG